MECWKVAIRSTSLCRLNIKVHQRVIKGRMSSSISSLPNSSRCSNSTSHNSINSNTSLSNNINHNKIINLTSSHTRPPKTQAT